MENGNVEDVERLEEPYILVEVDSNILILEVSNLPVQLPDIIHECASKAMTRILASISTLSVIDTR
jgi:hypothetical protein